MDTICAIPQREMLTDFDIAMQRVIQAPAISRKAKLMGEAAVVHRRSKRAMAEGKFCDLSRPTPPHITTFFDTRACD